MTSSAVPIRPMRSTELPSVVAEHRESLPDGLYARLGDRFLHTYHSAYLASAGTASFVAVLDTRPVGFVTGIISASAHRLAMRAAWPRSAAAAALAVLCSGQQRFAPVCSGRRQPAVCATRSGCCNQTRLR